MKKIRKVNRTNLLLVLIFLIGMLVLLYPNISDYFNQKNSSKSITEYDETISQMSEEKKTQILQQAVAYNKNIERNSYGRFADMSDADKEFYNSLLNINGEGMMCYLKIDKLGVNLPVYHSTEEDVLQKYVGHIEGTSLPTGGKGTHCGLSGHRGLPSAVLFTNLDRMEVGDTFSIIVQGEEHYYIVDQITTVLPSDLSPLAIDPNQDYVTLVTCTPYGENTHRLMIRGVRVEDEEIETIIENNESEKVGLTRESLVNYIAMGMGGVFLFIILPIIIFPVSTPKVVNLRPWDDNIETVMAAANTVSRYATRANWEVDDITETADKLAALRKWNPYASNKTSECEQDISRPWDDYTYDDDPLNRNGEKTKRDWDELILEKVKQDWSPFDREQSKHSLKFSDIVNVIARGKLDPPKDDLKPYFDKEMDLGDKIKKRSKNIYHLHSKQRK